MTSGCAPIRRIAACPDSEAMMRLISACSRSTIGRGVAAGIIRPIQTG